MASFVVADLGAPIFLPNLVRLGIINPLITVVVTAIGVAAVYRYIPAHHPRWRSIRLPAVVVGVVGALFTQAFAFIAPRLIGIAALYGAIAAVFAVLAWLSILAQILLLGPGLGPVSRGGLAGASAARLISPGGTRSAGRSGRWPRATGRT